MEQFQGIRRYTARRHLVIELLKEKGPLTIDKMKVEFFKKYDHELPFSKEGLDIVRDWLSQIYEVTYFIGPQGRVYSLRSEKIGENKRKIPVVNPLPKRSRSVPDDVDQPMPSTSQHQSRQSRSVKFSDEVDIQPVKPRSKSEHRPRSKTIGTPNIHGVILIADDFLMSIATYHLNFKAEKVKDVFQSGYVISGQTIMSAARNINDMENEGPIKSALIYLGSIDILIGRELIHMMSDFAELMKSCGSKGICPILCTLAPIANCSLGNRKDTLLGFNDFIRENPFGRPVIDISKCFWRGKMTLEPFCFTNEARNVTGCKKALVFWSKVGRDRVTSMLEKNIGLALMSKEQKVFAHY